jgi:predicted RND superfamily exporter protein
MEELLVKGQVYSLWGALILIFLLMLFLWRSLGSALLCMIPNISPILLIFIIMGLFGLWLDMATAMIASVAVGIAVDDTIHVYHGYISRVNAGIRPIQALARTFSQAGRAVVTTTTILSAQFMILVSSLFQPTTHFGLLTSIGLWAALVFDLLLLPAIIILTATLKKGFSRQNPA